MYVCVYKICMCMYEYIKVRGKEGRKEKWEGGKEKEFTGYRNHRPGISVLGAIIQKSFNRQ